METNSERKIIIHITNDENVSVSSCVANPDELIRAYVALTAHVASNMDNAEDIYHLATMAARDALAMIRGKNGAVNCVCNHTQPS